MAGETPNLGLNKPVINGNKDTWGELTNENWDIVDANAGAANAALVAKADKTYVDAQDASLKTYVDQQNSAQDTVINGKANANNAALTGNPTAPTPAWGDNDTSIATTEFINVALGRVPLVFGDPRNIAASDAGQMLMMNAGTVVVPDENTVIPQNFRCDVVNWGGGVVNINASAGVNISHKAGTILQINGQYAAITLIKIIPNVWLAIGDLTPG